MTTERASGHSARGSPRRSAVVGEPGHGAVVAVGEEVRRGAPAVSRRGVGRGDADDVEALARGPSATSALAFRSRGRRSGSAAGCRAPDRRGAARKDGRDFIRAYHAFAICVLFPWHLAEIVDARQLGRGGEVGEAQFAPGQAVPPRRQIADIAQMIADIAARRADRRGVGRAAALADRRVALVDLLGDEIAGDLGVELAEEPVDQPADLGALGRRRPASAASSPRRAPRVSARYSAITEAPDDRRRRSRRRGPAACRRD